jgi:hypothetical protein
MDALIYYMIAQDLKSAFARWGIEATEEKIRDLYKHNPGVRDGYLEVYNIIVSGKGVRYEK